jgi:DNA invertase Pin-like site-specific DNA recombinase
MVDTLEARRCPHNKRADDYCRDCISDDVVSARREGMPYASIARAVGWSETTVRRICALRHDEIKQEN